MNKRDLKFILAPLGVIFGISLFVSLFLLIAQKIGISVFSKVFSFIPFLVIILLGIVLVGIWLPIFITGIYFLGRRGAVGQSKSLRTSGIYRYIRNPMYSGISFTIIGFGFLFNKTGVVLAGIVWLWLTFIQSKREEKELNQRFGREYTEYKEKTPMFIPNFRELLKGLTLK